MRVILQSIHCHATTEPDGDEVYCLVAGARIEIGNFDVGAEVRLDKLLWNGSSGATIRFMENDENEPGRGGDDLLGEVTVNADCTCTPGHNTLDEGFDESKRYRQFSLQGSGAHYVVRLEIVA